MHRKNTGAVLKKVLKITNNMINVQIYSKYVKTEPDSCQNEAKTLRVYRPALERAILYIYFRL